MDSKKRLHSGSSDISDEHIDSLLGPEESPITHSSKKTCLDDEQRKSRSTESDGPDRRRSGSGSPTKF